MKRTDKAIAMVLALCAAVALVGALTAQASAAIDRALSFVEASNKRIAAMERKAATRKAA